MALKPCIVCGRPTTASGCRDHALRNGSTRAWRTGREQILARDRWICQLCGAPAEHVDHIRPLAAGGTDHPADLRATCARCNLHKGDG
jgi:5-methylcytosine-specific restriction endonuclease McrA